MRYLCLVVLLFALINTAHAKEPYDVFTEKNTIIPIELFEYYTPKNERTFGQTLKTEELGIDHLKNAKWEEKIQDEQSYINGFWVKYQLLNKTDFKHFGLDHQNNFFKLIYVLGEDGETVEVHKTDIESGIYDAITGEHFYDNIKIKLPKGEIVTVYSFFRVNHITDGTANRTLMK